MALTVVPESLPSVGDFPEVSRTHDGYSATRSFRVTGIDAPAAGRAYQAITAPGIPQPGEGHPYVPGIEVLDVNAKMVDLSIAVVSVSYGVKPTGQGSPGDEAEIELSSALVGRETNVDIMKDAIFVTYTVKDAATGAVMSNEKQGKLVEVQRAQMIIRASRRELANPETMIRNYVNTVNVGPWRGFPDSTVLFAGATSRTTDGGLSYQVTYEFVYDPDGHDVTLVYEDPETGVPPSDAIPKDFKMHSTANFGVFNFDA